MATPVLPMPTHAVRADAHGLPGILQRLHASRQSLHGDRPDGQRLSNKRRWTTRVQGMRLTCASMLLLAGWGETVVQGVRVRGRNFINRS